MKTQKSYPEIACHIHLEGQVQGVGFRPYVYRLAKEFNLKGWVSNNVDGVHIEAQGRENDCRSFCRLIIQDAPINARVTSYSILEIKPQDRTDFQIRESMDVGVPNLLITPDLGICDSCRSDVLSISNRRHHYAFTTCTNCGPRYSIIQKLPYDRENTTMESFVACDSCLKEYNDVQDKRYYSQTNSCPDCAITLSLVDSAGKKITENTDEVIHNTVKLLTDGKIIAMKGIGGYLLLCDATNEQAIKELRKRKNRPAKPLAVLYPSLTELRDDVILSEPEEEALTSSVAPIVLLKSKMKTRIAKTEVAPGLNQIGVMLPYTPLMVLLSGAFGKPLVATSGNEHGSPIFYKDEDALQNLGSIGEYLVVNNREIVVPQDDSVIRYTKNDQRIIVRRSRGLAPTFLPNPLIAEEGSWLAMGSDMKSAFTMLHQGNVYASQYLGDLENFKTQESFSHTLNHWIDLLKFKPQEILVDKHPHYFSSSLGRGLSDEWKALVKEVQHHKAHFAAVLAENNLLDTDEPVLGVIWDGTGWGEDDCIWGGEFFLYRSGEMTRVSHLDYYNHILGDKFSREPRLAALSLFRNIAGASDLLKQKFTETEWRLYDTMLNQDQHVKTSSMGRLFDGVASMLGLCDRATYEGEAAMYLEALASKAKITKMRWSSAKNLSLKTSLQNLVEDILQEISPEIIAWQFHISLVNWIERMASRTGATKIAFSGGVFQNALLVTLIQEQLVNYRNLYFHKQLSPNDECIGFGQLAWNYIENQVRPSARKKYSRTKSLTVV